MKNALRLVLLVGSLTLVVPSQATIAGQFSKQETASASEKLTNQASSHNRHHHRRGNRTNKSRRRHHRATAKK